MKRSSKNKAFTFLEVLCALVILSAALIPLMVWMPASIQTRLKAERATNAAFLAQAKIEQVRFKKIADFSASQSTGSPQQFPIPYQDFYYNVTDALWNANLTNMTVKVWHRENPGDRTTFYTHAARR